MKDYLTRVFGVDLRSLAVVRVGCALVIILNVVQLSSDSTAFFSDYGVAPRTLIMDSSSRWHWSLHHMSGTWQVAAALFVIEGAAAVALLVGYRTRIATILSWLLFLSLYRRNPHITQGGDILLRVTLFWGMFLPWGARGSVDSAWRGDSSSRPNQYFCWATAAYAFQILFVYWFAFLHKSGPEWWSEGSAIHYALNIDYLATPVGKVLVGLPDSVLQIATWAVLGFEAVGPFLLLLPVKKGRFRLLVVLGFVWMHLMFLLTMFIGFFPLVGISTILFFLPSEFWDDLRRQFAARGNNSVKIYYDQDCGFCFRSVRLIKAFLSKGVKIVGAQTVAEIDRDMQQRNSWVVIDETGSKRYGYDGVVVVAAASPVLRPLLPLLKLPRIARLGERIYGYVANHRRSICPLPAPPPQSAGAWARWAWVGNCGLAALVLYVLVLNIASLPVSRLHIPEIVRSVSHLTGLDQAWDLFAPGPAKDDGWFVIPGKLAGGATVDLFRGGKAVSFKKPASVSLEFKNHRWRKYMQLMRKRASLQPIYARYLCREWNRRHSGSETLEELEIIFVLEWTQPPSEYSPIEKQSIGRFQCGPYNPPQRPSAPRAIKRRLRSRFLTG
jgi:predicted DCC family thiol-disulfide oxidoreductase YuxK